MIVFAILGLALGIAIGVYLPVFPQLYSKLVAVAFMASLDAAFGGLRAVKEGTYDSSIFISGFSLALSLRHKKKTAALKKAVLLMLLGSLITAVTLLVMPQDPIWFGVLFLLGAAALVLPLLGGRTSLPPAAACFFSFLFFFCTRNLPTGFLGFEHLLGPRLPSSLYTHGLPGAFLGFRGDAFHSADYFPLFPWVFLFAAGYFACRALLKEDALPDIFLGGSRVLSFPGRHSLLIYLLHQPLLVLMMPGISLF